MSAVRIEHLDLFSDIENVQVDRLVNWAGLYYATVGTRSLRRLLGRRGYLPTLFTGAAVDLEPSRALTRAHGEFRERLAASTQPQSVRCASEEEISSPTAVTQLLAGVGPRRVADVASQAATEPYDWVSGRALYDQRPVLLPAQAVYLSYEESQPGVSPYWHWSSSGLAAGATVEAATMRAVLELVERDRFMWHWCTSTPTEPVDARCIERNSVTHASLRDRVAPWRVDVGRMDTQGLPVHAAICTLTNPHDRPAFAIGAAAGVGKFAEVAHKAFLEAVHVVEWLRNRHTSSSTQRVQTPSSTPSEHPEEAAELHAGVSGSPSDFWHRPILYADPEQLHKAQWLIPPWKGASTNATPPDEPTTGNHYDRLGMRSLIHSLHRQGCKLYARQLSLPADRFTGLTTVRVMSPDLQPISACHQCQFVKPSRIGQGPYNPDPHPFP